ncbi:hypothetical protein EGW08_022200 [Elysia chlorotica]|uniref:Uncharacterized protein n=1 Tax=Elysia chlorotica TaxID=188477 RepID=A0A433SLP3_ELYCH|nr:hypothetical protein EGW08_022200 [Elysia chlorotica]
MNQKLQILPFLSYSQHNRSLTLSLDILSMLILLILIVCIIQGTCMQYFLSLSSPTKPPYPHNRFFTLSLDILSMLILLILIVCIIQGTCMQYFLSLSSPTKPPYPHNRFFTLSLYIPVNASVVDINCMYHTRHMHAILSLSLLPHQTPLSP